jgi:hypothetical protein
MEPCRNWLRTGPGIRKDTGRRLCPLDPGSLRITGTCARHLRCRSVRPSAHPRSSSLYGLCSHSIFFQASFFFIESLTSACLAPVTSGNNALWKATCLTACVRVHTRRGGGTRAAALQPQTAATQRFRTRRTESALREPGCRATRQRSELQRLRATACAVW